MATNTLGLNVTFPIYNSDGSPFHNLVLKRSTMESSVMALDDKITGDVYYKDNSLSVTLTEYIEYKHDPSDSLEDPVRFILVSPPTILREGMVSDNGDLHGMCKYSFVFYHPMCALSNIPFSDIAVTEQEGKYLSQSKTFYWIGTLSHFVDKLNANLAGTVWTVALNFTSNSDAEQWQKSQKLSEVLSFDQVFINDALKTAYDTWEIPFTISQIRRGTSLYTQGKRFLISFGKPNQTILDTNNQEFTFRFGQGVGLKNNSKTPRNNKIVTRIIGKGSENNIPYGYPQIRWYGQSGREFTYGDHAGLYTNVTIGGKTFAKLFSYPIYKGIYGGQYVELIKHPFTRDTLMPTVYVQDLFNKVSPYAVRTMPSGTITVNQDYNPDNELRDYYDAGAGYVNQIDPTNPCVEIHQFEDIKPELDYNRTVSLISVEPITNDEVDTVTGEVLSQNDYLSLIDWYIRHSSNTEDEQTQLRKIYQQVTANAASFYDSATGDFPYEISIDGNKKYFFIKYTSPNLTLDHTVLRAVELDSYTPDWDDTMRDDGTYVQSYFKVKIPQLDFDLYACASITEKMDINMRSGACIGCTFPVQIDWDDYKRSFYDVNGDFDPVIGEGHPRDGEKYPDSSQGQITLILKKELDTFGILMPNIYQQPKGETSQGAGDGDVFVILGISLPSSYIDNAQTRLDSAMREYMLENNVHYYEYPLKFDEYFLATHTNILKQIQNNCRIKFQQSPNESPMVLFVKQIVIKYWESTLPQYDITLSDDIEIVLNKIGQVTDDVSRMRVELSEIQKYYSNDISQTSTQQHNIFLHKDRNDSTNYNLALRGNTTFGTRAFVPDSTGYGYYEDKTGERAAFLQVENLKVLGKMEAKEVEIQEVNYVGGSIVLTPANGFTAVRVVPVDENFDETDSVADREGYKIFYNRKKDDGTIVRNTWKVGDLAYCERWDLKEGVQTDFSTHRWWRKVLAVSTDYVSQNELDTDTELGWIVVSDVQRQMESLSNSVPMVDDKVVMLGHDGEDADRQTAIILSASQQYAPYIRMYKGIPVKSQTSPWYRLPDAFIDLNGRDTKITADTINISSSGETKNVGDVLGQLGGKLDHKFEIWQVDWTVEADAAPTLNDEPASSWTTAELRAEHEGDFIILSDGRCFQFSAVGQTYEWKEVSDKYLIDYVTMIGSKSSVFNGTDMRASEIPKNYKANDIWVNCQYHNNGIDYRDEILVATRDYSGAASINDWTTTNNYKADVASYKEAIENIVAKYDIQPDGKHETYFVDYDTTQYSSIATLLSAIEDDWIAHKQPDQDAEDVKKEHIGDLCYVKPYTGYPDGRLYEYTRRLVEADGYEYYEYGWESSNDEITMNMLMNIHDTQAAVDGKVNTFFYPSPSEITDYHQGDLLVIANNNGNPYNFNYMEGGEEKTKSYKDETLVCISDYNGSFSITDWKPIGDYPTRDDVNAMMEQYKVNAGLIEEDDFADLYAHATLNGVEVAGGHVTPKVTWVDDGDGTGHWESEVKIQADEVIVNGQTTFLSAVSNGLALGALATQNNVTYNQLPQTIKDDISNLQTDLGLKATPEQIYLALLGQTTIEGGLIKTELLDVNWITSRVVQTGNLLATNGTFTGTLSGVDGTFSGELSAATGTFGGTLNAAGGTFGSEYHGFSFIVSANEQKVDIVGPEFVVGNGTSEHPYEKASGGMSTNSRYISLMNLIPTSYKTTDTSYTGIKGLAGQIRLFGTEGGYYGNTDIYRSYLEIDPYHGIVMGSEFNNERTVRCKITPTGEVLLPATTHAEYASNAAAKNAGLPVGAVYRRGDFLCIVHD